MNQNEFVESCLIKYRHELLPPGQKWEEAHYPLPVCKKGTKTVTLWSCDHSLQGLLQSEELDHPCIDFRAQKKDRENLEKYYPEYVWLHEKWLHENAVRAGKRLQELYPDQIRKTLESAREICRERKIGVYAITPEQRIENGKKGGSKGGGHNRKTIFCVETGELYSSSVQASEKTGVNRGHIGACCRQQRKTAGGYHWKFFEETNGH